MRILTNDPSFTAWGYAVIEMQDQATKIIATGCIKTEPENKLRRIRKSDDRTRRIAEIVGHLMDVIKKYKVGYLLCEAVHGSQNASAAIMMGATLGIVQSIATITELPVEYYSESDSKKALANIRSLSKANTIKEIKKLYSLHWPEVKYKDEAIADAIAIFHCAIINSEVLRYHKLQQQSPAKVFTRTK